jgi:hypothetical protein
LIGFSKKKTLSLRRLENVQNEALLHVADPNEKYASPINGLQPQFLHG